MSKFIPITEWADDDKPREKLERLGKISLSNAELLGILIATGSKKKSAIDLAKEILQLAENNLNNLAKLTIKELCKISGIGPAKAITIIAAIELGGRRQKDETLVKKKISCSKDAYELAKNTLEDLSHEEFWIYTLKRNNTIITFHKISEGGFTGTVVDIRRIFKIALEDKATGIVLYHNHPSGNINPSDADKQITRKIVEAGKILDIQIIDHIIVAQSTFFSFADEQLL